VNIRIIRAILVKDLLDAIQDSRVLMALIVPLGIGLFYNFTFDDETARPQANLGVTGDTSSALPSTIDSLFGDALDLKITNFATEDELRADLDDGDTDLGVVIPDGFDAAVQNGSTPRLDLIEPPVMSNATRYLLAAIDPALRALSGSAPPADVQVEAIPESGSNVTVTDVLGVRTWAVYAAIVLMITMIGMMAVPIVLTEETEKKTYDALIMVASNMEIIVAKALLGVCYVVVAVPLLLRISGISPVETPLFVAAIALLTISMIGFGLFLAGFLKSATQLNTWSGLIMTPLLAPAFIVGLPTPGWLETAAGLFLTGSAAKLIFDSASDRSLFSDTAVSFLIIGIWGVVAYALLYWRLSRRQA
jgi:ABC-2 type transport system permease protein